MAERTAQEARAEVESALSRFGRTRRLSEANEQTTRCELIDAILNALGWGAGTFDREVPSGAGDYLDYELKSQNEPWLVVEAKRAGSTFALDASGWRIGGSNLRAITTLQREGGQSLRDVMRQATTYCNDRAVPFACVTNGFQWVFFRGLSSEGVPWNAGRAVVFVGPDAILSQFDSFLGCLGRNSGSTAFLARMLDRPTDQELPAATSPATLLRMRVSEGNASAQGLRRGLGRYLFAEIHGGDRANMLTYCYVQPGLQAQFDTSIRRLLRDTAKPVVDGEADFKDGDAEEFIRAISWQEQTSQFRYPVVVVGHVGVGKTTFLHSTLEGLRRGTVHSQKASSLTDYKKIEPSAIYAYVDLENYGAGPLLDEEHEQGRVARLVLERLRTSALSTLKKRKDISDGQRLAADPFQQSTMRTMLRDDLDATRSTGRAYFDRDPAAWERKEYEVMEAHQQRHLEFLIHYIRHLRARFRRSDQLKYPVLITIDNLDQASNEYQRCIYALALRLAKETPAVVVVSMREDTFSEGRRADGFLSSSPMEFVFHVPAPPIDRLLRQRVRFGQQALADGKLPGTLGAEADAVAEAISEVDMALLGEQTEGLEVVAALAGHNIRDALRLVREMMLGGALLRMEPDGSAEYLLECVLAVMTHETLQTTYSLANVFEATVASPPRHGLRLRVLGYLAWTLDHGSERGLLEQTAALIGRFTAWGYPAVLIVETIEALLELGLVHAPESGRQQGSGMPRRVSITASGYAHLTRLARLPAYRAAMACATHWYSDELVADFVRRSQEAGSADGTTLGDILASAAPTVFEAYLAISLAAEDRLLSTALADRAWLRETLSRTAPVLPKTVSATASSTAVRDEPLAIVTRGGDRSEQQQFELFEDNSPSHAVEELPRIPRNLRYGGTVWIPRILWALEYGRCNGGGALSASDLARSLVTHGDIDVPATNVARALRDLKRSSEAEGLWIGRKKRYEITPTGTALIRSLIEDPSTE